MYGLYLEAGLQLNSLAEEFSYLFMFCRDVTDEWVTSAKTELKLCLTKKFNICGNTCKKRKKVCSNKKVSIAIVSRHVGWICDTGRARQIRDSMLIGKSMVVWTKFLRDWKILSVWQFCLDTSHCLTKFVEIPYAHTNLRVIEYKIWN